VDLTNTTRFYNKEEVEATGCKYVKLQCQGYVRRFFSQVLFYCMKSWPWPWPTGLDSGFSSVTYCLARSTTIGSVSMLHLKVRLIMVSWDYDNEDLIRTTRARRVLGSNPDYHDCELNALPLSHPTMPYIKLCNIKQELALYWKLLNLFALRPSVKTIDEWSHKAKCLPIAGKDESDLSLNIVENKTTVLNKSTRGMELGVTPVVRG